GAPPSLPSFPTRRSSDLHGEGEPVRLREAAARTGTEDDVRGPHHARRQRERHAQRIEVVEAPAAQQEDPREGEAGPEEVDRAPGDRKSTRLNSSHVKISY